MRPDPISAVLEGARFRKLAGAIVLDEFVTLVAQRFEHIALVHRVRLVSANADDGRRDGRPDRARGDADAPARRAEPVTFGPVRAPRRGSLPIEHLPFMP